MTRVYSAILAAAFVLGAQAAQAEEQLNLYSSRHYDTDERLYSEFTAKTGIKINRIEDNADVLIERIKAEGRNSPADLLLTTDVGRLWAADEAGLFQSVRSKTLEDRIPAHLRHKNGHWFGFSKRARIIFYAKERVNPDLVKTYAALADPALKGKLCTRSSGNVYMLSLMAAQIAHRGEEAAKAWAKGMWDNRARDPEGGDTDQLRGIVSGQCDVVLANTYYFARATRQDVPGLKHPEQTGLIGVMFPDQDGAGAHINISGGGLLKHAPNRGNAIRFLEYLVSESAQKYFSGGNDEYPVVKGVEMSPSIKALGTFKADDLDLNELGRNQALAQRLYDAVGYK